MKHAASRSKSTVKSKAKTNTQAKAVTKAKPSSEKPISKVALKSRRQKTVQKTEAAAKTTPTNSARAAKPTTKKIKLSAKTLNALRTISARKIKSVIKQIEKPKVKKVASKILGKTIKTSAQKTKPVSSIKKVAAVEKKTKKVATTQKANRKTTTVKPKVSAKPTAKTLVKTAKPKSSKVAVRIAKPQQLKVKTVAAAAKVKSVGKKAMPSIAAKKIQNAGKTKPIVAAKPDKRKKTAPVVSTKKVSQNPKKFLPVAAAKKQKPIIEKNAPVKKTKPVQNAAEVVMPPQKPKNKKARPISSAVFRGKKERYDFKVFALNEKFEPIPAVYIISKRKTDRNKRGHHALICIGETGSISDELKRHRKGKCVKKHAANVVSILPEPNEKIRLKIETDLKAAHNVACNFE